MIPGWMEHVHTSCESFRRRRSLGIHVVVATGASTGSRLRKSSPYSTSFFSYSTLMRLLSSETNFLRLLLSAGRNKMGYRGDTTHRDRKISSVFQTLWKHLFLFYCLSLHYIGFMGGKVYLLYRSIFSEEFFRDFWGIRVFHRGTYKK